MVRGYLVAAMAALAATTSSASDGLRVVTDLPIVATLAGEILGDRGSAEALLGDGVSPHDWALRPSEAQALADADLIVWVGAELSPGLGRALDAVGREEDALRLLSFVDGPFDHHDEDSDHTDHSDHDEDGHEHHDHGRVDPHVWLNPSFAAEWAELLAGRFAALDTDAGYSNRAADVASGINKAAEQVRTMIAESPPRYVVAHDALGHFASAFDAPKVDTVADFEAVEPGLRHVQTLDAAMAAGAVDCLLVEAGEQPKLALSLADRHDVKVIEIDLVGRSADSYAGWLLDLGRKIAACGS